MQPTRLAGPLAAIGILSSAAWAQTSKPHDPAADALNVTARIAEAPAGPGALGSVTVTLEASDGWSITNAGLPGAVLQLDLPDGLTLAGDILTDHRALARNGFLHAPFERMVQLGDTSVEFSIDKDGSFDNGALGINVVAYMRHNDAATAHFVRKRFELNIEPNAAATTVDSANTSWGDDRSGLQVGDKAKPFTLPRADGTNVDLNNYLGKKNIIVTTYRAFW